MLRDVTGLSAGLGWKETDELAGLEEFKVPELPR